MTTVEPIGLLAAFVVGAAGSAHCFGMCGGIAGALKLRTESSAGAAVTLDTLMYQAGRIATYAILGALVGAAGEALRTLLDLAAIGNALRAVGGVLLLMIAARLLLHWNALAPIERLGNLVWKFVQPLTKRLSPGDTVSNLLIGMCWGLLPCAMVYSALAFAAVSGSALTGAATMAAFGLGTMPALFVGSLLFSRRSVHPVFARRLSGLLLVAFGLWMIAGPSFMTILDNGQGAHAAHIH
jgi:sulfite exporter TauE/SafE